MTGAPRQSKAMRYLSKLREWLRRYLPLEIAATAAAVAGGLGAALVTANPVAIAYAGTWSENAGYYGVAFMREFNRAAPSPQDATSTAQRWLARSLTAGRRLVWEFGAAELVDSFLARPLCMYWGVTLTGQLAIGLIAGKLAADALFYAIAIVFYEAGRTRG